MAKQNNASKTMWEIDDNSTWAPPAPSAKYHHLSDEDKSVCFGILKRLLQEPCTLQDGLWDEEEKNGKVFKLIYGRKVCKVSWKSKSIIGNMVVSPLDIYLQWRGNYREELSLKNLQTVQNELKVLGVQDEKVHACFSVAKNSLVQEPSHVQCNSTLNIFDEVILTFGQGWQKNMTVMYDEKESTAVYYI